MYHLRERVGARDEHGGDETMLDAPNQPERNLSIGPTESAGEEQRSGAADAEAPAQSARAEIPAFDEEARVRVYAAINQEARAKETKDSSSLYEFIERVSLEEYEKLHEEWNVECDSNDPEDAVELEPLWYKLHKKDIAEIREIVRNPKAPRGTLSEHASKLAFFYRTLPLIAGGMALGWAAAFVTIFFGANCSTEPNARHFICDLSMPGTYGLVGLLGFLVAPLLLGTICNEPAKGFAVRNLNSLRSIAGFSASVLAGFTLVKFLAPFLLRPEAPSLISIVPTAFLAVSSAAILWAILTFMKMSARGILFHKEKEERFEIRTKVRNIIADNEYQMRRYLERACAPFSDYAPEGLLKQRLISRRDWDLQYNVELMHTFLGFDIFELGSGETERLLRRWGWVYLTGIVVMIATNSLTNPELSFMPSEKVRPLFAIWAAGGAACIIASSLALKIGVAFARKKYQEAIVVVKPKLSTAELELLRIEKKNTKINWQPRYGFDDLLRFVKAYRRLLENYETMQRQGHPPAGK